MGAAIDVGTFRFFKAINYVGCFFLQIFDLSIIFSIIFPQKFDLAIIFNYFSTFQPLKLVQKSTGITKNDQKLVKSHEIAEK